MMKYLFQVVTSEQIPELQITSGIKKAGDKVIKKKVFDPQNNITTFELAQCLNLILASVSGNSMLSEGDVDDLGAAARHFKDA